MRVTVDGSRSWARREPCSDEKAVRRIRTAKTERPGQSVPLRCRKRPEPAQKRQQELMQRRETKLGLRLDPQQADDFEVPARLDRVVKERGLAGTRLAVKHQGGAAAPPRRLKDAVDLTALQLTI